MPDAGTEEGGACRGAEQKMQGSKRRTWGPLRGGWRSLKVPAGEHLKLPREALKAPNCP